MNTSGRSAFYIAVYISEDDAGHALLGREKIYLATCDVVHDIFYEKTNMGFAQLNENFINAERI